MAFDKLVWVRRRNTRLAQGSGNRAYRVAREVGVFSVCFAAGRRVEKRVPCISFAAGRALCQRHHETQQQIGRDLALREFERKRGSCGQA
jgi:hypothetical protein